MTNAMPPLQMMIKLSYGWRPLALPPLCFPARPHEKSSHRPFFRYLSCAWQERYREKEPLFQIRRPDDPVSAHYRSPCSLWRCVGDHPALRTRPPGQAYIQRTASFCRHCEPVRTLARQSPSPAEGYKRRPWSSIGVFYNVLVSHSTEERIFSSRYCRV